MQRALLAAAFAAALVLGETQDARGACADVPALPPLPLAPAVVRAIWRCAPVHACPPSPALTQAPPRPAPLARTAARRATLRATSERTHLGAGDCRRCRRRRWPRACCLLPSRTLLTSSPAGASSASSFGSTTSRRLPAVSTEHVAWQRPGPARLGAHPPSLPHPKHPTHCRQPRLRPEV